MQYLGMTPIAELGPGAAISEISLVSGEPAVVDVVAVEPAVLLRLSRQDFDAVARKHPTLLTEPSAWSSPARRQTGHCSRTPRISSCEQLRRSRAGSPLAISVT
jgi:hypothetical protein